VDQKKKIERAILTEFRAAYSAFPEGDILDGESPDFTLVTTDATFGFEVRALIRGEVPRKGSPKREREVFSKKVTQRAQRAYEGMSPVPVMAHFHWLSHMGARVDPDVLALSAAQIVAAHPPTETYGQQRIDYDLLDGTPLEGHVRLILLRRLRAGNPTTFARVDADFISVGPDEVQRAIDAKINKVAAYRDKCDHVWLIVWVGSGDLSANANLEDDAAQHSYRTHFDRVFFFDRLAPRVISLNTHPA
jgi:hypothetical protein